MIACEKHGVVDAQSNSNGDAICPECQTEAIAAFLNEGPLMCEVGDKVSTLQEALGVPADTKFNVHVQANEKGEFQYVTLWGADLVVTKPEGGQ